MSAHSSPYATQAREIWSVGSVRWGMAAYLLACHVLALCGLLTLPRCHPWTVALTMVLWPLTAMGVTAGSHRLWSHRSYRATLSFRVLLMLLASAANQGSIFHWVRDHRVHHRHSETPADPHDAGRGFFFAHIGWLLVKKDPRVVQAGKEIGLQDLLADPVVRFHSAVASWWNPTMCFLAPTALAHSCWNESVMNALLSAGFLRYVCVLHATWLVNSAAHMYGRRPYAPIHPTENWLVSLLSCGEGWHNWHHKYPYDYSASEKGFLRQFNPTTALIDLAAVAGCAYGRKRATRAA